MMRSYSNAAAPRASGVLRVLIAIAGLSAAAPAAAQDRFPMVIAPDQHLLVEAVVRASPELRALRSEAEAARARAASAGFAPPVVLSGEIEDVPDGYDFGAAAMRLELGREFLTGGRSAAARALAAADVSEAEAALMAAEIRLRAGVVRELAGVAGSIGAARRLAAEDSLLIGAEVSLRDRFGVGEARYVDVLRLRTERLRVQTERAEAVAEGRLSEAALLGLAGEEGEVGRILDSVLLRIPAVPAEAPLPPPPSRDSLLALSSAVRVLDAAVERARAALDAIRADQRPRLAASLGAQRTVGEDGGSVFGPVLGASVTLPFTAGRANEAATRAAEREVAAAEAARTALVARIRGALAGGIARYEAARERLAVYDAALLRGAREERESALAAYRTGELSLLEFLDFERALSRAEIDHLRAHADAVEAYAELIAAAAGGS